MTNPNVKLIESRSAPDTRNDKPSTNSNPLLGLSNPF